MALRINLQKVGELYTKLPLAAGGVVFAVCINGLWLAGLGRSGLRLREICCRGLARQFDSGLFPGTAAHGNGR